jgi:predicted cation transporter
MVARFLMGLSPDILYWINTVSAALDNATLAAVEVSPSMPPETLRHVLMGLLLAGIMLIPGNLPNIIVASKLGIKSSEWAKWGFPLGLLLMVNYFWMLKVFG